MSYATYDSTLNVFKKSMNSRSIKLEQTVSNIKTYIDKEATKLAENDKKLKTDIDKLTEDNKRLKLEIIRLDDIIKTFAEMIDTLQEKLDGE